MLISPLEPCELAQRLVDKEPLKAVPPNARVDFAKNSLRGSCFIALKLTINVYRVHP